MQPYFLPYIGYFQLIASVDKFIILDDVNYIKKGWINRNRILLNGQAHNFSIPLLQASQNKYICEMEIKKDERNQEKLLKTFRQAYSRAPYYQEVYPLIEEVIKFPTNKLSIYLLNSIKKINLYLGLTTEIINSSKIYKNTNLKGQERIIDICLKEKAETYLNAEGGHHLYDEEKFKESNINLKFIKPSLIPYKQMQDEFIPSLSILDILMFNKNTFINNHLLGIDIE